MTITAVNSEQRPARELCWRVGGWDYAKVFLCALCGKKIFGVGGDSPEKV